MTELMLPGLDGSNPLAFLAAMGTLQSLADAWPDHGVHLGWRPVPAWRPFLQLSRPASADDVVVALDNYLQAAGAAKPFEIADDLKLSPEVFREWAAQAAREAMPSKRRSCDFVAAFGCEAVVDEDFVADTAFRTMSGAGHQHFLATMRELVMSTKAAHLQKALFEPWRYDDPLEKRTMRWDPIDDRRYALRWNDPSADRAKSKRGSVQGANRLAIEGLRLFPTAPASGHLVTAGFTGRRAQETFFSWSVWTHALPVDVIRSVLAMPDVQSAEVDPSALESRGIAVVFRSRRLTVGKFRSFSPAQAL